MTTNTTQTLGPLQREWVDKLRNGGLSQITSCLHKRGEGYCCLGLALEHVLGVKPVGENKGVCIYECDVGRHKSSTLPPIKYARAIGLRDESGIFEKCNLPEAVAADIWRRAKPEGSQVSSLAELNDKGFTFAEIADLIEAHPSAFFKEAR